MVPSEQGLLDPDVAMEQAEGGELDMVAVRLSDDEKIEEDR